MERTLEQRLIRVGFAPADASAAVAALGDTATLNDASHWIGRRMLESILTQAGFTKVQ